MIAGDNRIFSIFLTYYIDSVANPLRIPLGFATARSFISPYIPYGGGGGGGGELQCQHKFIYNDAIPAHVRPPLATSTPLCNDSFCKGKFGLLAGLVWAFLTVNKWKIISSN